MKRCSAPCVSMINKIEYFEDVASASLFHLQIQNIKKFTKDIDIAVKNLNLKRPLK